VGRRKEVGHARSGVTEENENFKEVKIPPLNLPSFSLALQMKCYARKF
jgi:hypothetical protein